MRVIERLLRFIDRGTEVWIEEAMRRAGWRKVTLKMVNGTLQQEKTHGTGQ